jgi:hypothetical protein
MQYRPSRRGRAVLVLFAALACSLAVIVGASAGAQAATLPTLNVAITPNSIAVAGAGQAGAMEIVSTGPKESELILFHLNPGATSAALLRLFEGRGVKDPNQVLKYASIVFDAPTGQNIVTGLEAGEYVAMSAEGEKGPNPKVNVAFKLLPNPTPAAMPAAQATVQTIEFGFRGPSVLHVGETVNFINEGFLVHMDVGFRTKSKKAARKLASYLVRGQEKQAGKLIAGPPVSFFGPLSHGAIQQERISANPGWYVEACFMNTQDGREHTRLGMVRVIRIVK